MIETRPAPYPANTKAKGWRFELDLEQVMQSDTWALARPDVKPWLLMLWTVAWQQTPCGSMPADDELIIARLGIDPDVFERCKKTLLRGWWLADDGRLYHPTITQRVLDMLGRKDAERTRKAEWRARKEAERKLFEANEEAKESQVQTDLSRGTGKGQTQESHVSDDTGTGTGTGLDSSNPPGGGGVDKSDKPETGSAAGFICRAIRAKGIADTNPSNPTFLALLEAGATRAEFEAAAESARKAQAGFNYVLSVVKNERKRAAELAGQLHKGALPGQKLDPMDDPDSRQRIEADGIRLGIGPWVNFDDKTGQSTPWPAYAAKVKRARGDSPAAASNVLALVTAGLSSKQGAIA